MEKTGREDYMWEKITRDRERKGDTEDWEPNRDRETQTDRSAVDIYPPQTQAWFPSSFLVSGCMLGSTISHITPTRDFGNMQREGEKKGSEKITSADCLLASRLCLHCVELFTSPCVCVCVGVFVGVSERHVLLSLWGPDAYIVGTRPSSRGPDAQTINKTWFEATFGFREVGVMIKGRVRLQEKNISM